MNSIKILYDHQVFATQKYGGVSRIFYQLIRHLSDMEEVQLLLFHGLHINRYPLHALKNKTAYYFGKAIAGPGQIQELLKPLNRFLFKTLTTGKAVDIFHPTHYARHVYEWKNSPLVLTVNDMIPELYPTNFRDIDTRLMIKMNCIQRADHIITISNNTKIDLQSRYDIAEDKITVVYPGAPSPLPVPADARDQPPHPRPFILYVGTRRQPYKNLNRLLLAYASSQRISKEYDLVCFGGPPLTRIEQESLRRSGISGRVVHMSGDDRLLANLYRNAAVLVYPSLYEGFGLPPLEAMANGCPVLTGRVSSLPEILDDAAVYFDPSEPDSIAAAIEQTLSNETQRAEMIRKGYRQVKKYDWTKMTAQILELYRRTAG
jgi:glycosyltransferase involved in cell wall biosynthesis